MNVPEPAQNKCPFSKLLKKLSNITFKKQKHTHITRELLEKKLKKEESSFSILTHKENLIKNKPSTTTKDRMFMHNASIQLLTNLWEQTSKNLKNSSERQELISKLANVTELTNLGSTQKEDLYLFLKEPFEDELIEQYDTWDKQFEDVGSKPIGELSDLELNYRLINSMDRLFGKNKAEPALMSQFIDSELRTFYPLITQPNLTKNNLDTIIRNSIRELAKDASKHTVHSTAREKEYESYVNKHKLKLDKDIIGVNNIYDKSTQTISLNPELSNNTEEIINYFSEHGFNNYTTTYYGCPALVTKIKGSTKTVFQEILEFKLNHFRDIYLALEENRTDSFVNQYTEGYSVD